MRSPLVLGFETSCDETAVGIVRGGTHRVLSSALATQIPLHAPYSGVVPELASRAHLDKIHLVLERALRQSGVKLGDLDAVSYTQGPGLKGSLLVGEAVARSLAMALGKPAVGVHHLEGHLAAILLSAAKVKPPFLGLVVSGGHTDLVHVKGWGHYRVLGRTLDDACGEALDKFAKMLKLGYPGGPVIDRISKEGDPAAVRFPRAVLKNSWNFSFSGLKTSALYWLRDNGIKVQSSAFKVHGRELKPKELADLAASFQEAVCETLLLKTREALFHLKLREVVVAGGVACNSRLRRLFQERGNKEGWESHFPPPELCSDNGAMIALMGALKLEKNSKLTALSVDSTLPFTRW